MHAYRAIAYSLLTVTLHNIICSKDTEVSNKWWPGLFPSLTPHIHPHVLGLNDKTRAVKTLWVPGPWTWNWDPF
jgi:hypothetical protein